MAPPSGITMSSFEKQRTENIESNKKMLESLGLFKKFKPILDPLKKHAHKPKPKPALKRKFESVTKTPAPTTVNIGGGYMVRRSLRVKGIEPDGSPLPDSWKDREDEEYKPVRPVRVSRENYFGAPEGIPVGYHWDTRMECSADGVHRPTVAGIHGNESIGCYSIALSGGYEDDIDLGESFTYTGAGGRDLKGTKSNPKNLRTAPQSKDQTLDKVNLALSRNVESRHPVRVIRGYKLQSAFSPEYGYRYDGLYTVEKFWSCTGLSGFLVYKYILKRVTDQPPPPWKEQDCRSDSDKENEDPELLEEARSKDNNKDPELVEEARSKDNNNNNESIVDKCDYVNGHADESTTNEETKEDNTTSELNITEHVNGDQKSDKENNESVTSLKEE